MHDAVDRTTISPSRGDQGKTISKVEHVPGVGSVVLAVILVLVSVALEHIAALASAHSLSGTVITVSGTPSILAFADKKARAFIGTYNYALGRVAIINTHSGQVVHETNIGMRPLALSFLQRSNRLVVLTEGTANTSGRGSLHLLDATSGAVLRTTSVGLEPNALAVDETRGRVLVTTQPKSAAMVTLYDIETLTPVGQVTLERGARPIALTAAAGRAAILSSSGRAYLLDEDRRRVTHMAALGQGVGLVKIDPQDGRLWVVNQVSNTVSMLDLATGALLKTVGVGPTPSGLGLATAAGHVLVTNAADGTLTLLDARSGTRLRTVAVGRFPRAVVVDQHAGLAAIPTDEGVSIVDAATGTVVRRLAVTPGGVAAVAMDSPPAKLVMIPVTGSSVQVRDLGQLDRGPAQSAGPTQERSLALVRGFVDAYNRHDLSGVLATMADRIQYGDCDYTHHLGAAMRGPDDLRKWLLDRFAEHEQFLQAQIFVPPGNSQPPVASLTFLRVSDALQAQGQVRGSAAKIFLTPDGSQLSYIALGAGANCLN